MRRSFWVVVVAAVLATSGCNCKPDVMKVKPTLAVTPPGLDFSKVKVGNAKALPVKLEAQSRNDVVIESIAVEGPSAAAFRLGMTPATVAQLSNATFTVTFAPTTVAAFTATLVVKSNDPDHPTIRVAMAGEGAMPKLEFTPDCKSAQGCTATVVVDPPSIDFGLEPLARPVPLDPTKLPTLVIVNAGDVELDLNGTTITGPDSAAFTFTSGAVPDGGLKLDAMAGVNLPIRFVPTSAGQTSYSATVTVTSDDPDQPSITVPLTGGLKPNDPPFVCANLVRVVPQMLGDAPRDYSSAAEWSALMVPPPGGYDFTANRDVRPGELATFSAISDSTDMTKCSADPEDGRTGLTYLWELVMAPAGVTNLPISGTTTQQIQLRPIVTGSYTLRLTVTDRNAASVSTLIKFVVAVKQDLVAQLEWTGFSGVDLDLHLVRPTSITTGAFSGTFSFFNAGVSNKTSGDINGYAVRQRNANMASGFDFDWGLAGELDNPTLNVDDVGDGQLFENISLNYPENDALCDGGSCTYAVVVHYFKDARAIVPPACFVDAGVGCGDGEQCSCAMNQRCVATAAPAGSSPSGNGKCYAAPKPVVRLFFRGSPTPANVIPLDTLMPVDEVLLGAPCTAWHVADIAWPAAQAIGSLPDGGTPPPVVTVIGADGMGRIANPSFARFGVRASGSLDCTGDSMQGPINWYSQQPR
ncbi:MAG: choice-of-anchor D domain-containing protein [Archangium sp.]